MAESRLGQLCGRVWPSLLSLLLLSGCAVGPNYRPPQPEMPESWPVISSSVRTLPAAPLPESETKAVVVPNPDELELARWWTRYNDETLNRLVDEALAGNLNLQAAEQRILEARANKHIASAAFWPQVNTTGQVQRGRVSAMSRDGGSVPTTNLFQAGFDALWELDIFGGTRRSVEAAQADMQAAIEDRRDILVTLVAEVGSDYLQLRGYQKQLAIARENVVAQQKSVDVTQQRYRGGFVPALDVANAQAQVATTRAQIPVLETFAWQTIHSLSILLGREPDALAKELAAAAPIPAPPATVPAGLPSDLLRRRPDIRRSEAQLHAATARIGVAKADLFPKFSLTGQTGLQSPQGSSLTKWANRYWNTGPSLTWPILAGGRIGANIQLQKRLTDEALLNFRQTVLGALGDVDNALIAYTKEKEHYQALSEAVTANTRAVELATKLYANGQTDFLNVLSAQGALYQSQNALVLSETALATDVVALYKALGGGWSEDMENPCPPPPPQGAGDAAKEQK